MLAMINKLLEWFKSLFWKEEMELTLVGLQHAGKTTFVNVIASGNFNEDMIPTVGFNMRKISKGNVTIKLWDIGGQPRFRSMWERYCRYILHAFNAWWPYIFYCLCCTWQRENFLEISSLLVLKVSHMIGNVRNPVLFLKCFCMTDVNRRGFSFLVIFQWHYWSVLWRQILTAVESTSRVPSIYLPRRR